MKNHHNYGTIMESGNNEVDGVIDLSLSGKKVKERCCMLKMKPQVFTQCSVFRGRSESVTIPSFEN